MQMEGRKWVLGGVYRYGFNGKENDNEVKGEGNSLDFGARIYDPRIGRFLSVDPLVRLYPGNTPFGSADNNPIALIDREGENPDFPDPPVRTKRYIRVKYYADLPKDQRLSGPNPATPANGQKIIQVGRFLAKTTSVIGLILTPLSAGDHHGDEIANFEREIITSDSSSSPDDYLQEVKRRLQEGRLSDQEHKYVDEMHRRGMLDGKSNEAHNLMTYERLKKHLSFLEKVTIFLDDGTLRPEIIKQSTPIQNGAQMGNKLLTEALTSDGSKLEDWNKMSYQIKQQTSAGEKTIDVHFYYNQKTNKTYTDYDYKVNFSGNYYKKTEKEKDETYSKKPSK